MLIYRSYFALPLLLFVSLCCVAMVVAVDSNQHAAVVPLSKKPILDLIGRRVPALSNRVQITFTNNMTKGASSGSYAVVSGILHLAGPDPVTVSRALYDYLKNVHNGIYLWGENSTGVQLNITVPLSDVPEVAVATPFEYRYALNVCTFGYSAAFWDWPRWEWEIDWMALHGVNTPLAFSGQEYVWAIMWLHLGATEAELQTWFSGPAFLPWQRMGNMGQWNGPLSEPYRRTQYDLQVRILKRMRSFGMTPVLPCFSGHVPAAIQRLYPNASVTPSQAWNGFNPTYLLEPTDPLFVELGAKFLSEYRTQYGVDGLYNCDTYNEQDPKSADPSYLAQAGRAIADGIKTVDPTGRWVVQGWTFQFGFWQQPGRVEAYLSGVPAADILVLDLNSEAGALAPKFQQYYGRPWVWNLLHNYGGERGMYGKLSDIVSMPFEEMRRANSTMVGIGITPEAIEQNPIVYEMLFDVAWAPSTIDVQRWVQHYAECRYGPGPIPTDLIVAWDTLRTAVYDTWTFPHNAIQSVPSMCGFGSEIGSATELVSAWASMLAAASNTSWLGTSAMPAYRYDLIDVSRMGVSNLFDDVQKLLCAVQTTWEMEGTSPALIARTQRIVDFMVAILTDLDALLGTIDDFLLGRWIRRAENVATSPSESAQFVAGAVNQVTLWGTTDKLTDYAAKAWQGMYGDYYGARWARLGELLTTWMGSTSGMYNEYTVRQEMITLATAFYQNKSNINRFPSSVASGGPTTLEMSTALYNKYVAGNDAVSGLFTAQYNVTVSGMSYLSRSVFSSTPSQLMLLCALDDHCACVDTLGDLYADRSPLEPINYNMTLFCKKQKVV
eukprot:PhM_4_TR13934/c0_g1_i1/m.43672/K01205/NAGLU; alpha-N-acetylglucosaminidase